MSYKFAASFAWGFLSGLWFVLFWGLWKCSQTRNETWIYTGGTKVDFLSGNERLNQDHEDLQR